VICNSTAFSKYVNVSKSCKLILWINTPTPMLWMDDRRNMKDSNRFTYRFIYQKLLKRPIHAILKKMEQVVLNRADKVIAISKTVQDRITNSYHVDSEIINPPIHTENIKFNNDMSSRKKWFFYVGRIESYKGVELAIRAAIKAKVQFKFGGVGSQLEELKNLVTSLNGKGYVQYLGYPTQEEKYEYFYNCKALISPIKQEDFGMVPLEANAAGAPVIAFRSGSAVEVLSEDNPKTAVFFDEYDEDKLAEILQKFDNSEYNAESCRKHANEFSTEIFKYKFKKLVEDVI
jgi:glycosyltransferase involved in cell wall biosynthesis